MTCGAVRVLALESSCDETAAAAVEHGRLVRANVVASQADLHAEYGGVFPEMASRQHVRAFVPVAQRALAEAGWVWDDVDVVAVTRGPGLAGSLVVGVNFAKGLALGAGRPLVGVNHLMGHIYSNWLHVGGALRTDETAAESYDPPLPYLTLIASGGHTDLVLVRAHDDMELLGSTLDDAAGEALDKAARTLGLGYPGGPAIEAAARGGDPRAVTLPLAQTERPLDFSFSGLKTALLTEAGARSADGAARQDLAASFQDAVVRALVRGVQRALGDHAVAEVHLAGGVSANGCLREALAGAAGVPVRAPPAELCTDNAAMIGAAAHFAPADGATGLDLDVVSHLHV